MVRWKRLINKIVFKCAVRFFLYDSSDYNKTLYPILVHHYSVILFSVLFIVEGKVLSLQPTVIIGLLVGVSFQSFIIFSANEGEWVVNVTPWLLYIWGRAPDSHCIEVSVFCSWYPYINRNFLLYWKLKPMKFFLRGLQTPQAPLLYFHDY